MALDRIEETQREVLSHSDRDALKDSFILDSKGSSLALVAEKPKSPPVKREVKVDTSPLLRGLLVDARKHERSGVVAVNGSRNDGYVISVSRSIVPDTREWHLFARHRDSKGSIPIGKYRNISELVNGLVDYHLLDSEWLEIQP